MTTELPHTTVIIPAKNEEEYIGICLSSILALDYPASKVDITVIDNGSSDRTREIAEELGATVLFNDSTTIAGLRNMGAQNTRGDILAFLDADMEVDPGWLREAVKVLEDPDTGAVGGLLGIRNNPTWVESTWVENKTDRPQYGEVRWLGSGNFLMRREVFDQVGGWNEALTTCEDLDICERISRSKKLMFVAKVFAIHHGSAKSLGEVFRKELWRGKNNFQRSLGPREFLRELPTLTFPVFHGIFLLGLVASILFAPSWIWLAVALSVAFPFLRALRTTLKTRHWAFFPRHFAIWFVYYTARSIAPLQFR